MGPKQILKQRQFIRVTVGPTGAAITNTKPYRFYCGSPESAVGGSPPVDHLAASLVLSLQTPSQFHQKNHDPKTLEPPT